MTLRTRLALLVTLAVAVAVGPVLYLTWRMGGETMIRMEEKTFSSLLLAEEESLNAAFMGLLASKVLAVHERKNLLREHADKAIRVLAALEIGKTRGSKRERLIERIMECFDSGRIRVELLHPQELAAGGLSRLGLSFATRDAKQRPLHRILERLPRDGEIGRASCRERV